MDQSWGSVSDLHAVWGSAAVKRLKNTALGYNVIVDISGLPQESVLSFNLPSIHTTLIHVQRTHNNTLIPYFHQPDSDSLALTLFKSRWTKLGLLSSADILQTTFKYQKRFNIKIRYGSRQSTQPKLQAHN